MSISPSELGQDGGRHLAGWTASSGLDDQAFDTIGQTVRHAAGAIDGLKDILERLQNSVALATEQRRNDIEIGRLFTRAQDFVEGAVNEGHELAQRIIADAEFEAARIIAAAKEEAHRLVEEGRNSATLPSEAVRALQATIGEFGRMNDALVQELSVLAEALTSHRDSRAGDPPFAPLKALSHMDSEGLSSSPPMEARPRVTESQQDGGSMDETPLSSSTGYWDAIRTSRQAPGPRMGRHSAPGSRWRTR